MADPLWTQLLVAGTGPVLTAGLALAVVNVATARAQRRNEGWKIRSELTSEVTEIASGLYLSGQAYERAARDVPLDQRRGIVTAGGQIRVSRRRQHP